MKQTIFLLFALVLFFACEHSLADKETTASFPDTASSIELRNSNDCSSCANLISNPSLNGQWNGSISTTTTFGDGIVPFWTNAYRTPHHTIYNQGTATCGFNGTDQVAINCLGSRFNNSSYTGESVVTNIEFSGDQFHTYCVNIDFRELICNGGNSVESNLLLRSVNDLSFYNFEYDNYNINLLDLSSSDYELIGEFTTLANQTATQKITINNHIPNSDYSQFEIINMLGNQVSNQQSRLHIEDVEITCENIGITGITASESANGITFQLTNESSASIAKYNWDFGNGEMSSESTPEIDFLTTGTHVICVDIIDEFGCCGSSCIEIEVERICDYEFCWAANTIYSDSECTGGNNTAFIELYAILPNSNSSSKLSLSPEFNFDYCNTGCSDFNGVIYDDYISGSQGAYPIFFQDLNDWFTNNPQLFGLAEQDDNYFICRAGSLLIENTNVKFLHFDYIHGNDNNPCSDIVQETSVMEESNCTLNLIN